MFIKNLVSWAGDNFAYHPGQVVDLPSDVAEDRIAEGLAAPVEEADEPKQPKVAKLKGK